MEQVCLLSQIIGVTES